MPGRRELNKARTRERLLEALHEQLRHSQSETLTAEAIAEAAGVSRRTFFNYFPTVEAALAAGFAEHIAALAEAFLAQPDDLPPLVAMQRTVEIQPVPEQMLAWLSAVRCSGPERHGMMANLWGYHRDWLEQMLLARVPGADPLAASTLAGTVMAVFEAVERQWQEHTDGVSNKTSTAEFNRLLSHALGIAASGWVTNPTT